MSFLLFLYLCCTIREMNFVEDLWAVLLDGVHFHLMRSHCSGFNSVKINIKKVAYSWTSLITEMQVTGGIFGPSLGSYGLLMAYLSIPCSLCRQAADSGSLGLDSKKRWVCFSKAWLGGKSPQQSHNSCQPRSILNLWAKNKNTDGFYCIFLMCHI